MAKHNTNSIKKLHALRKQGGYTNEEMAKMLDISKSYYWQIENGARRVSYDLAIKIAKIFELKPDDVFYEHYN